MRLLLLYNGYVIIIIHRDSITQRTQQSKIKQNNIHQNNTSYTKCQSMLLVLLLLLLENKDRVTPQSTHNTENTQNITDKNKGINQQH